MEYVKLRNGVEMPRIGLGTWQITDRVQMAEIVESAYQSGYRLIDTAAAYSNEIALAKALAAAEIKRTEMFLSDKVWNTSRGAAAVQEACRKSLKKLKTEYLEVNADTWRGMEQLYKDGLVRAIGVCNFKEHHLTALEKTAEIIPMVNQLELHPGLNQSEILDYCKIRNIQVEASSPLGNGQILSNEKLVEIANRKEKTPAQICLRWELQKGIVAIPKTTAKDRLVQNIEVFDFTLDEDEMKEIDAIPYCGGIGIDPDEVFDFG